jgi:general secretion pathway protein K
MTRSLNRNRAGTVVLLVLGYTTFIAFVSMKVIEGIRDEIKNVGFPGEKQELRLVAHQALELSIAVLAEIRELDQQLYSPSQGWGNLNQYLNLEVNEEEEDPLNLLPDFESIQFGPGIEVQIRLMDESGKIPLNLKAEEALEDFFLSQELNETEASILKDSLLDWIDSDNKVRLYGAEKNYYRKLEDPVSIPNKFLEFEQDLFNIQGFEELFRGDDLLPNQLFAAFWNVFTLYQHRGVNYNTANPETLLVLDEELEFDAEKLQQFLAGPDNIRNTKDDRILRPNQEDQEDYPRDKFGEFLPFDRISQYFKLEIETSRGNSKYLLSSIFDFSKPGSVYPCTLLKILENQKIIHAYEPEIFDGNSIDPIENLGDLL